MISQLKTDPNPYYYQGLADEIGDEGLWHIDERWPDVEAVLDLQRDDEVLDIGCAEGLISMRVAARVRFVLGVEVQPQRRDAAEAISQQRRISNIRFDTGSVCDIELEALSYDVVLFLGVFHHLPREGKMPSLNKLLKATRRQIIIRTPLLRPKHPNRIMNITGACEANGFDFRLVPNTQTRGGDLVVANRRA